MKKRIEDTLWVILENAPTVLTILFAVIVIGLSQVTTISTDIILQWVLAILGLLAISELLERWRKLRRIEDVSNKTLEAVQSKFGERARAEDFFLKRLPSLEQYLLKAKDIRLMGYSLQRTIRENSHILSDRLKDNGRLCVMIVNPDMLKDKPVVAEPGRKHDPLNSIVTLKNLKWLSNQPDSNGTIELKFLNEEPRFNIIAIDVDETWGIIFVEFYPQRWVPGSRPRVELIRQRDGYWYEYFKDQFDKVWSEYPIHSLNDGI